MVLCIICYDHIIDNDPKGSCKLPCKHFLHLLCWLKWERHNCPLCRCEYSEYITLPDKIKNVIIDQYNQIETLEDDVYFLEQEQVEFLFLLQTKINELEDIKENTRISWRRVLNKMTYIACTICYVIIQLVY